METAYDECQALRQKFIEDERKKLPYYFFKGEGNDIYLTPEVYAALEKRADKYFQQCLEERSVRAPKL
jgi:hypothetical protein